LSRRSIGGAFLFSFAWRLRPLRPPETETAMIEDSVFKHLRMMLKREHALPVQSCRVSTPVQRPWGRTYRLVEWTMHKDAPSHRCVVPAEFTDSDIARLVAAHVPGRLYVSEAC
jgi:hypothetical protein